MLPSSGYFKSLTCPFFKTGFCERPHCHFRHVSEPASSTTVQLSTNDEAISGATVPAAAAASAPATGATSSLPLDSNLLQEMVSRAVREALQSGATAALSTEAIAASLAAAPPQPLAQPADDPQPEPEPEPEPPVRKHRVYPIPASVSYKPTPLKVLKRRRSTAEPRFSDDDDDDDGGGTSPAPAAASGSGATTRTETEAGSKSRPVAETAAVAAASATKQSEEFDLLEQIMAESSKPTQMTTTLRRKLRARPVVFRAKPRGDGDEAYEPVGGEPLDAATPLYQPTRKADSVEDGGGAAPGVTASVDPPAATAEGGDGTTAVKGAVGSDVGDTDAQRRAEESTSTASASASVARGALASGAYVLIDLSDDESRPSLERHVSSDGDKAGTKKDSAGGANSEYSSRNGYGSSVVKTEPVDVKTEPVDVKKERDCAVETTTDHDQNVNGAMRRRSSAATEPSADAQSSRKRSRTSSEADEQASKRRRSESGKTSVGSADRDRSRHDSKHRDKSRSSGDRDKHSSSKDRDKHSSREPDKHRSSKDRDKHSSKDRDKHSSAKDRDGRTPSSKDCDKRSSSHKSHSKDAEKSKSRSSIDSDEKSGPSSKSRSSRGGEKSERSSHAHRDKSKSSHSSSTHGNGDRSKDKDGEKRSEHRSSSHSQRDKSRSSKDRDRSSSSRTRDEKSSHKSSNDAHKSSSSKHRDKHRSSKDAARSGDPSSRPGPSSGGGTELGQSKGRRADTESTGGRSGSGSPLPDLSALEELPDMWELPDGLLQPSDLESDSDGDETLAECERMFNEYKAPADVSQLTAALNKARALQEKASKEAEKSNSQEAGKKRVAHTAGLDQPVRPVARAAPKMTASQAMHARWQKLAEMQQQRIAQLEEQQRQREAENSRLPPPPQPQPPALKRRRVAHVPNVGALLQPPAAASLAAPASAATPATAATPAKTAAQTAPRGGKRLAHTPTSASVARPKIPADLGGKVPTAIRQRYLDHFCTELLKVYPGDEAQAFRKALEEEQVVYSRSPSRRVYVNLSVGAVKRIRDAAALKASQNGTWVLLPRRQPLADLSNVSAWPYAVPAVMHPHHFMNNVFNFVPHHEFYCGQLSPTGYGGVAVANRTVSHLDVLAGRGGATGSWSIERNKKADEAWTPAELYARMTKRVLTEEQLDKNGFPRPDPLGRPGRAHLVHVDARARITRAGAPFRICIRCAKTYEVSAEGEQVVPNGCSYHWGRAFTLRGVSKFRCCSQVAPAEPCCYADCHVSDNFDPDNLIGYMATMDKAEPEDGNHGVFALDCEMSYTTQGCELTRVTVVDSAGNTVYETIVKPDSPVIDFNTRFSGIKESDMEGVTVSIRDVQAVLLNMFSKKTILIGHSLESDFKALKLIHPTVADTSVAFPHKNGPPLKRGLKMLCQEYLKRFIQDAVGGHDSAEDAISAMDLMLWRLREDAKLMR